MNLLPEIITREVADRGVMCFARFMELALYCPVCGYYEKEADRIGKRGDFFTSVSVGGVFGELLAFQFAEWLDAMRSAECGLKIVEAGAHCGTLARDVLTCLRRQRPEVFHSIQYCVVEPSARRQQWQKEALREFGESVRWVSQIGELAASRCATDDGVRCKGIDGIIFSNELLDAMPVHRLGWDARGRGWFEWGVGMEGGRFVWRKIPGTALGVPSPRLPDELLDVLPDGFIVEISPAAEEWWAQAAAALNCGKLLTIDYGFTEGELLSPERSRGTVRAYVRHRAASDVLADPGGQDITAHVNFTAIQQSGERAGLTTEALLSQEGFLTRIAERAWADAGGSGSSEWTPARVRAFQTLTHPEHLGRSFRVLLQSRDAGACSSC